MSKISHRDISPLLQRIRAFLLGRELTPTLRFQDQLVARTQPPPHLPDGETHKLNDNYYYSRDVRREVAPPLVVASKKLALESGGGAVGERKKLATPGPVHHWD